jgi:2-polyprenyl-6-methoxyphenol hydroxylase-like FAD-dependent oxidoreductase
MVLEQGVAIIGAGLGGLAMALFLKKANINCTIYELRTPDVTSAGAIMLSPNALRSLDAIGVYDRIKGNGYHFRDLTFNTNEHKYIDAYEMGNADKYGFDAFRVYRQVILDELKAMVKEAGIPIFYSKKFSRIISDSNTGVTFAFADGEEKTVDLLIGADGIHSSVRKHIVADVKPAFSNVLAVTCAIPTAAVKFPYENYPMPVSIHGPGGAFVLAPQNPEGSELLGGIQHRTHERTREGWDEMWNDKEGLLRIMKESYDSWNEMVQTAMDAVPLDTLSIWSFYTVPKLPDWKSDTRRVVLIGDAAHAIPPAAGQGVNQAFEDVHSLSLLMAAVAKGEVAWNDALDWWQQYRQARVDRTVELTERMNVRRLPGWMGGEGDVIDSSWLFSVQIEKDVAEWVEKRRE